MNTVILKGFDFSSQDVDHMNSLGMSKDISYINLKDINFLPAFNEIGIVIIQLMQSISFDATYDTVKYILLTIIAKIKTFDKNETTVLIKLKNEESIISFNFELSNEQKDKIVDAAVRKLLGE